MFKVVFFGLFVVLVVSWMIYVGFFVVSIFVVVIY